MLFIKSIITLAVGQALFAAAAPLVSTNNDVEVIAGYKTTTATFIGEVFGEKYEVEGTAESVHQQLSEKYPGRNMDEVFDSGVNATNVDLEKRRNKQGIICIPVPGQSWQKTYSDASGNAAHIIGRQGRVRVNGRSCARVACYASFHPGSHASIHVCNDRDYAIEPALPYIATYVYDIMGRCQGPLIRVGPPRYLTGGQMFDSDGYNVVVQDVGGC